MKLSREKAILSQNELILRDAIRVVGVFELLMAALLIGLIAEGYFQNLAWIDTFLNGAVVLGKIVAGLYILYAAIILITYLYILFIQIKDRQSYRF